MDDQIVTYRTDLYYINRDLGGGYHSESIVGPVRFYATKIFTFWRWHSSKGLHVLKQKGKED